MADHEPLGLRCSLPGLDAAGRHGSLSLVCLRLGDAVAFAEHLSSQGDRQRFAFLVASCSVQSRLSTLRRPGQILISPRVLMKVGNAVKLEPVGEFALKGIRRPLAAYNVVAASSSKV